MLQYKYICIYMSIYSNGIVYMYIVYIVYMYYYYNILL